GTRPGPMISEAPSAGDFTSAIVQWRWSGRLDGVHTVEPSGSGGRGGTPDPSRRPARPEPSQGTEHVRARAEAPPGERVRPLLSPVCPELPRHVPHVPAGHR